MEENKPRIRLNVKTTAKGECQLDVTVETFGVEELPGVRAFRIVEQVEFLKKELKLAGWKMAGEDGK
jgi:hypothetical protein